MRTEPLVVSIQANNAYTRVAQRVWRTRDLLDRASEPRAGAKGPEPQGVCKDNPDCYECIVERLGADRVEL